MPANPALVKIFSKFGDLLVAQFGKHAPARHGADAGRGGLKETK